MGLGGGLLRYDIPVFWDNKHTNLRLLVEYDGEFHFNKYYEEQNYEKQQIHDKMKDEYCIRNNIILVRIPYLEFDNIEEILIDILIHDNMDSKFIVNNKYNNKI